MATAITVAIIDYGLGNIGSVQNALASLEARSIFTNKFEELESADRLILPGVGAFRDGIRNLEHGGLIESLTHLVTVQKKPILGICLGMQLFAQKSYEGGEFAGLGWINAEVRKIQTISKEIKVPHVGWNETVTAKDNPITGKKGAKQCYYFVHSYAMYSQDTSCVLATCDHAGPFVAAVQKDNIYGVQFHPEKSQKAGLSLLRNFLQDG